MMQSLILTSSLLLHEVPRGSKRTAETKLQTHDLALETSSTSNQQPSCYHLFLILTPESITTSNLQETLARITRFSTLTTSPSPTVAFLLSANPSRHNSAAVGLNAYIMLQSR